jgi:hypothetical protein
VKNHTFTPDCLYPSTSEKVPFITGPDYGIPASSDLFFRDIFVYEDVIMKSAPFLEFRNPNVLDITTTEELEKCVQVFLANPTIPGEFSRISKSDKPLPNIGSIPEEKLKAFYGPLAVVGYGTSSRNRLRLFNRDLLFPSLILELSIIFIYLHMQFILSVEIWHYIRQAHLVQTRWTRGTG